MKLLNIILSRLIPFLPKSLTYQFAKRYVAGISKESVFKIINRLNSEGYLVTVDILGEHTKSISESEKITNQYIDLYEEIDKRNLKCNISLKPSHIGADVDINIYKKNIEKIISISDQKSNFLRIDMESSKYTDLTIQTFKELRNTTKNVGTVFQAYLHRTYDDIAKLKTKDLNFRLCKGIYIESDAIAINNRMKINKNYLKILKYAFQNKIYVGIATHDTELLESIYRLINKLNPSNNMFEFQTLYGVPMHNWNKRHLQNGYNVRIYVPYGQDWYKYSVRRLKENPNMAGYIIKNLFLR